MTPQIAFDNTDNIKMESALDQLNLINISRNNAANYALTYSSNSSGTSSYNSLFEYFEDNNCQNFASQCVWKGLDGVNDSTHIQNASSPMVTSGNTWYQKGDGGQTTLSWNNVDEFANLIWRSGATTTGPYGWYNTDSVCNAEKGDILQYHNDNPDDYIHSFVVNTANGTAGSRTFSDLYVCAHTNNRRNVQLSTLFTYNQTNLNRFRTVRIIGGYY